MKTLKFKSYEISGREIRCLTIANEPPFRECIYLEVGGAISESSAFGEERVSNFSKPLREHLQEAELVHPLISAPSFIVKGCSAANYFGLR